MQRRHFSDSGSFLIFVDHCDCRICSGRYVSHCLGESGTFGSLDQLLLELEEYMDLTNNPQAFQKVRYFFPSVIPYNSRDLPTDTRQGRIASFSLHIHFRRNASWQGSLSWLDRSLSCPFRSVLELLQLLNNAIFGSGTNPEELWLMEG